MSMCFWLKDNQGKGSMLRVFLHVCHTLYSGFICICFNGEIWIQQLAKHAESLGPPIKNNCWRDDFRWYLVCYPYLSCVNLCLYTVQLCNIKVCNNHQVVWKKNWERAIPLMLQVVVILGGTHFHLWGIYMFPKSFPSVPHDVSSLSVGLYVALGDIFHLVFAPILRCVWFTSSGASPFWGRAIKV